MPCTSCKRDQKIIARGYCRACYQRWSKNGSTDYRPKRQRTFCQVKDCDDPVVSGGLCDKHRQRLAKHGHIEDTRPDSWGSIETHPLRHSWRHVLRYNSSEKICAEWRKDFLQFALDVGERPSDKHKLFVANDKMPIGPGNFVWKRAITERVVGEDAKTHANRRAKVYRALSPEAFKGYDLKRPYGISRKAYLQIHEMQNGCCAICAKPETLVIKGVVVGLAVDHCHETGKIRGLLCKGCNQAIGLMKEDPEVLRRAIAYLTRPLVQHR